MPARCSSIDADVGTRARRSDQSALPSGSSIARPDQRFALRIVQQDARFLQLLDVHVAFAVLLHPGVLQAGLVERRLVVLGHEVGDLIGVGQLGLVRQLGDQRLFVLVSFLVVVEFVGHVSILA